MTLAGDDNNLKARYCTVASIMSAHGQSSPPPASAAVLEFICLFTHDLRRKQKRWQDGRLKYHTFNQRVMVYDERGNFVGDMHWRRDYDLDEGEELQLERGGVIVQVCELQQRTEQDLSELIDKRSKEKEQRQAQAAARTPAPSAVLPRSAARPVVPAPSYSRVHRPLHQVLGTPSGHHGKAVVPKESPFEQRHQPTGSPDERAAKRRKYEPPPSKSGYAQALFGQTLTLSATPASSGPVRRRAVYNPPPSSVEEESTQNVALEGPTPALREQPKTSRHFNQLAEGSRMTSSRFTGNRATNFSKTEEGSPDAPLSKPRSFAREENTIQRSEPEPADDDVIEIEHPGPSLFETRPQPITQKSPAQRAARIRDQASMKSSSVGRTGQKDADSRQKDRCHENERPVKAKKSKHKSDAPKVNTKRPIAEYSVAKKAQVVDHVPLPKKRSEPVTELRIKPRKKRGLLMLSEPPSMNSSEQGSDNSVAKSLSSRDTVSDKTGEDDHGLFPSPSPPEEYGEQGDGTRTKTSVQRERSTELGEDHPVGCPPPEPDAEIDRDQSLFRDQRLPPESEIQTVALSHQSMEDNTECKSRSEPEAAGSSDSVELPAEDHMEYADLVDGAELEDNHILDAEAGKNAHETTITIEAALRTSPPPQGKVYDPYRLPSSSPGEVLCDALAEPPSSLRRTTKAKSQTKSRRHVVLEDEMEADLQPQAPAAAATKSLETVNFDSDSELLIPTKKPKKALKFLQKKSQKYDDAYGEEFVSNFQEPIEDGQAPAEKQAERSKRKPKDEQTGLDTGSEDEMPTKRQRRSRKEAKSPEPESENGQPPTRQRQLRPKAKSPEPESEDEHPTTRRRSTRKTRRQVIEEEETLLLAEPDDSDQEATSTSKRSQKKKTLEDRPRLTRIKKNVKSRELVGFDLSALTAPLGIRGIGMPFSILSSPAAESLQKRIENHAPMCMSSNSPVNESLINPTVVAVDPLKTIDEVEQTHADVEATVAEDGGKESTHETPPGNSPVAAMADNQSHSGALRSPVLPVKPSSTVSQGGPQVDISKDDGGAISSPADDFPLIGLTRCDKNATSSRSPSSTAEVEAEPKESTLSIPLDAPLGLSEKGCDDGSSSIKKSAEDVSPRPSVQSQPAQSKMQATDALNRTNDTIEASAEPPVPNLQPRQASNTPAIESKKQLGQSMSLSNIDAAATSVGACSEPGPKYMDKVVGIIDECQTYDGDKLEHEPVVSIPGQRQRSLGLLRRTASITRRINNITIEPPKSDESSGSTSATESSTKTAARIANPASRGRKAALQSDAAGPVPQRLLPPTQPHAPVPICTADFAATQLEEPPKKEAEKPKRKMKFPGFQSARGEGPWSREAFDLLGSARPE